MDKLIVIVGPTAVGKTKLSVEIAKQFNGEIISGDSMQVYKKLDIGTAKVTEKEMQGIPHHMIDIVEPSESYTVADFKRDVTAAIRQTQAQGKMPILVGGSGLYIQAILYEYAFTDHVRDQSVTEKLESRLELIGAESLHQELEKVDSEQARKIHPNNHRRVIRALEIYLTTGQTMSSYNAQKSASKQAVYNARIIGLEMERELLYDRINARVDGMVEAGLITEVASLHDEGELHEQALQAIGYKEIIPYLQNEMTKIESINQLKQNSRRYAKRQYTWFRNQLPVNWYDVHPERIDSNFKTIFQDLAGFLND